MGSILIRHKLNNLSVEKESGNASFILAKNGAYYYENPESKYRGLYFPEKKDERSWTLFKSLEQIELYAEEKALINKFSNFEKITEKGSVNYSLDERGLIIESSFGVKAKVTLDMREIYDFDDKGRIYSMLNEGDTILIEYSKYTSQELNELKYRRYLGIKTNGKFTGLMKWNAQKYSEDEERKSYPWELYVFDALLIENATIITFSLSSDREKAVLGARKLFEGTRPSLPEFRKVNSTVEINFAYNSALSSMEALYAKIGSDQGFYAGLPWFFQFWTRDESISMKPLISRKQYDLAKSLLMGKIKFIAANGRISNRIPFTELQTADGAGWVFKRLHELIESIISNEPLEEYISGREMEYISAQLSRSIEGHISSSVKDYLLYNNAFETWMDTSFQNDTREGARIEIQALWLSMLSFRNFLDKTLNKRQDFIEIEKKTKAAVRKAFFDGKILKDGNHDVTIRPNIFLAYYIYPELLGKGEWEIVFDNSLEKLWLDWGGLSTIDKNSPLFCPNYTGEDNRSYHRGDSWFFLNNIAALCLHNLNKNKYQYYIENIVRASTEDILYKGAVGRPSELSSASSQTASGCIMQLWSAATYIELIESIYGQKA